MCGAHAGCSRLQSLGVTIGGAVIQNVLLRDLPQSYIATLPQGVEIAYAAIPTIRGLEEPLKDEVRRAFAKALQRVWQVMLGIAGVGMLSCLLMKQEKLRTDMDEKWALQEREHGDKASSLEDGKVATSAEDVEKESK